MCVDYTDLNKACPKDSYPSPTIDHLVDGVADHNILGFLGFMLTHRGIKANPEKCKAITEMRNPTDIKEI